MADLWESVPVKPKPEPYISEAYSQQQKIKEAIDITGGKAPQIVPAGMDVEPLKKAGISYTIKEGEILTMPIPSSPGLEASREYARIYGPIPGASAPESEKAFYKEQKAAIQSQMEAGTYVSFTGPDPYIQAQAEKYGISYQSAEAEARRAAEYVEAAIIGGKYEPYGITEGEIKAAIAYYESRGRQEDADRIRESYATIGHPEGFIKRAEAVGYDIFDELAPYREGNSYRLDQALADKVVTEEQLRNWFPEGAVAQAVLSAGVAPGLGAFTDPETGGIFLASAIAAGAITEDQALEMFGDTAEVRAEIERSKEIGVTVPPVVEKGFWQRGWEWLTTPRKIAVYEGKPEKWTWRHALGVGVEPTRYEDVTPLQIGVLAGGAIAAPLALSVAPFGFTPAILKVSIPALAKTGISIAVTGGALTGIGYGYPLREGEVAPTNPLEAYLRGGRLQAEGIGIVTGKRAAEDIVRSFEDKWADYIGTDPITGESTFTGSEIDYQRFLSEYRQVEVAAEAAVKPWYHPASLGVSIGTLFAPHYLVAEQYPKRGPVAFTQLIPWYGATWGRTALEWGELTPGRRALGIGVGFLPHVTGPIGYGLGRLGGVATRVPGIGPRILRPIGVGLTTVGRGVTRVMEPISPYMPWTFPAELTRLGGMLGLAGVKGLGPFGAKVGWWEAAPLRTLPREYRQFGAPRTQPLTQRHVDLARDAGTKLGQVRTLEAQLRKIPLEQRFAYERTLFGTRPINPEVLRLQQALDAARLASRFADKAFLDSLQGLQTTSRQLQLLEAYSGYKGLANWTTKVGRLLTDINKALDIAYKHSGKIRAVKLTEAGFTKARLENLVNQARQLLQPRISEPPAAPTITGYRMEWRPTGIRDIAPPRFRPREVYGTPAPTRPSTATMTQEALLRELERVYGLQTTPIYTAPITTMPYPTGLPGIRPSITPFPITEPIPTITPIPTPTLPGIAPTVSPVPLPLLPPTPIPTLVTTPYPALLPTPLPSPLPMPIPSAIPVTPPTIPIVPPIPPIPPTTPPPVPPLIPPPIIPPLPGGILGLGPPLGRPKRDLLGAGIWKYRGYPVRAPHPLLQEVVGYEWMKGYEVPWGIERVPTVTRRGRGGLSGRSLSGGLVRMTA